ncbi:hypothetical protein MKX01_025433 [Papaver californicum]|nr:hypothetical protein MKX01_025433 [Papaver californicum]
MPEEEDQNMNTNQKEEDFDEEEDEELEEDEDMEEYDEDEDLELDSPPTSSDPIPQQPSIPTTAPVVSTSVSTTTTPAIATTQTGGEPDIKRAKIEEHINPMAITTATEDRNPPSTIDDSSRKLFQRLWTDEDEIGLLQGFLEYNTKQRGTSIKNSSSYHHDTGPFYDHIKTKLQLEFNKNQLVEKLRRLKKKYRNVMSRISSGKKDLIFKTPHDQSCFEISKKIWGGETGGNVVVSGGGVEEEDGSPNPLQIVEVEKVAVGNNGGVAADINGSEKKATTRSRKRIRKRTEEPPSVSLSNISVNLSVSSVIEETVKSCLSPLFKELLQSAVNGPRGLGVMGLNPLNFGANSSTSMNLLSGEMVDEKWKKQQVLELEVYAKRMDLVQDQIKLALEELRSTGN